MAAGRDLLIAALVLVTGVAVACGREGYQAGGETNPPGTGTPPPLGDGHDGPLTLAASQVVNVCRPVTVASGTSLVVNLNGGGTGAFEIGRIVMIVQVQDQFATSGNTAVVNSAGTAGLWELSRIASVSTNGSSRVLALGNDLARGYASTSSSSAQACTVPEYSDVTVQSGGAILADPWTGRRGGVVALLVSGTLTLDSGGTLDASSAGFRGGKTTGNGFANDVTANDTGGSSGGGKGEGLDIRSYSSQGRGNLANGAGGGNARNAGGGGGGNGGAGGQGGIESDAVGNVAGTAGLGGSAIGADPAAILSFGGGGGAGQEDTSQAGSGGAGGGVVLVFAAHLAGTGAIRADGESRLKNAALNGNEDGAGGGGAGGSVLVMTTDSLSPFQGSLGANGGDGGNVTRSSSTEYGPGGGGGGGRILATSLGASATFSVHGGASGINSGGSSRSAAAGTAGVAVHH